MIGPSLLLLRHLRFTADHWRFAGRVSRYTVKPHCDQGSQGRAQVQKVEYVLASKFAEKSTRVILELKKTSGFEKSLAVVTSQEFFLFPIFSLDQQNMDLDGDFSYDPLLEKEDEESVATNEYIHKPSRSKTYSLTFSTRLLVGILLLNLVGFVIVISTVMRTSSDSECRSPTDQLLGDSRFTLPL